MIKYAACFENNSCHLLHEYKAWEIQKAGSVSQDCSEDLRGHTTFLSVALVTH